MLVFLQAQNPVLRPGVGTFTSHTFEFLFICLGMFLLGWFLHHLIHCTKHKALIAELEAKLKKALIRIGDLERDLESCNSAMVHVKGENAGLSTKLSKVEKELALALVNNADGGAVMQDKADLAIAEDLQISNLAADIAGAGMKTFDADGAKAVFGKKIKEDDFKIVEGVGPKTEGLLKDSSIHTWSQLGSTAVPQIQNILDKGGDRFRLLNPGTWPKQARMASDGKWIKLRAYQDYLINGVEPVGEDQIEENTGGTLYHMGKKIKQDDLTIVEGIGPKIQGLLQDGNIKTWLSLAETRVDRIQEILNNAGDRYRMHNPTTWPKQAEMAQSGQWEKLREYQEFLDGGKDPS